MVKTKLRKLSRRHFITSLFLAAPGAVVAQARLVEPDWLKISRLRLSDQPTHRFVYFTDLHHKGDRDYAQMVVKNINQLAGEFVCFGGDLVEDGKFLTEALEILSGIKAPLYGVPGHAYVYLNYGIHALVNVVTEACGSPADNSAPGTATG